MNRIIISASYINLGLKMEKEAENLGMIAFKKGLKSTPFLDKGLMEMIKNNPNKEFGSSIPLTKAWSRGWHKANISAPI